MGAKCCINKCGEDYKEDEENININNFIKKYPIGKGGFGRVSNIIINLFIFLFI